MGGLAREYARLKRALRIELLLITPLPQPIVSLRDYFPTSRSSPKLSDRGELHKASHPYHFKSCSHSITIVCKAMR